MADLKSLVLGIRLESPSAIKMVSISTTLAHARSVSRDSALRAALRSGADNPEVIIEERSDGMDTYRILAKAVGSPRLTSAD